ncbi:MAG: class I SAM-dependent methyltransferase [Clostridiales bacterium]|nr:class I SAM-dependent methyltransferase [Clostridiales bacterium]
MNNKKKLKQKLITYALYPITLYDTICDIIICRTPLYKYVPSKYRESHGATGSESTRYWILKDIFKGSDFSSDDVFIDVGCGKGRVLAYMIRSHFPGKIIGIELNDDVANIAKIWSKIYNQIEIISGDAMEYNYKDITVMFLGRPFLPDMFHNFISKLESEMDHKLNFYYWVDQQSGDYLNDRPGWTMIRREKVFKKFGFIYLVPCAQRYSVWEYDPSKK